MKLLVVLTPWLWPIAAQADCRVNLTPIAVTMQQTQPFISGRINGQAVNFLADTGAFFSTLSPAVAAQFHLNLRPINAPVMVGGVGGAFRPELATVKQLSLGPLNLPNVVFMVGGSESGQGAVGLLGQNLWRVADLEIDLANGVIRLAEPSGCADQSLAYWAKGQAVSTVPLWRSPRGDDHAFLAYAKVNGTEIKVEFDTGASRSYLTYAAARRAHIDPNGRGTSSAGASSGVGRGSVATRFAPVDSFQIGDETVEHTRLRLGDSELGDVDMLLGADFFLSHRVYLAKSQGKVYFTYNGGPVFALEAQGEPTATPPGAKGSGAAATPMAGADKAPAAESGILDATTLGRRGAGELGRQDLSAAISDLTKAHDEAPKEPLYLYQRALAYEQSGNATRALADLDQALQLAPDDVDALIARARLRVNADAVVLATTDLDAAAKLLPIQADQRFALGRLYAKNGSFGPALAQFDIWMKAHPDDAKMAAAHYNRCWIGAMGGLAPSRAMRACDEAVGLTSGSPETLAARGLLRLRSGDAYGALFFDLRPATKRDPKNAWALYGRGLAEMKIGKSEEGKADLAASLALDPKLKDQATKYGLAPQTGGPDAHDHQPHLD